MNIELPTFLDTVADAVAAFESEYGVLPNTLFIQEPHYQVLLTENAVERASGTLLGLKIERGHKVTRLGLL